MVALLVQAEASALTEIEVKRAEAAALLERRMAAMEAVLAARRSPPTQTPEPQAARGPGADLRFMVCNSQLKHRSLLAFQSAHVAMA